MKGSKQINTVVICIVSKASKQMNSNKDACMKVSKQINSNGDVACFFKGGTQIGA